MHRLDNKSLVPFMEEARPDWVACRWINVNGLSWDVIRLLGNDKGLHRLAIEDLVRLGWTSALVRLAQCDVCKMNTKNRTKADWYSDHTYSEFLWFPLDHHI